MSRANASYEIPKTMPKIMSWYLKEGGKTGLLFCHDYRLTERYEHCQDEVDDIDVAQQRRHVVHVAQPLQQTLLNPATNIRLGYCRRIAGIGITGQSLQKAWHHDAMSAPKTGMDAAWQASDRQDQRQTRRTCKAA